VGTETAPTYVSLIIQCFTASPLIAVKMVIPAYLMVSSAYYAISCLLKFE